MMKKIFSFLLTGAALLTLIPIIAADGDTPQREPDYYLNEDGSVGFMKKISEPNTNGVYTITLESFATGKSVKVSKSIPADIVLVLDMSGSMNDDMSGNETSVLANKRVTAMKNAVKAFIEQIDINDKYVKYVEEGSPDNVERTTPLGNKIAIVTYNSSYNREIGLTAVSTGKQTLITRVNNLTDNPSGGTRSDLGLQDAYNILEPLGDDRQLLTTVLFTDGDPGGGANWTSTQTAYTQQNTYQGGPVTVLTTGNNGNLPYSTTSQNGEFTWNTANDAIDFAHDIKGLANAEKEIFSSVFTVSIVTNPSPYTNVYLGKLSSNYPDATKMADLNEVTEWYSWQNGNYWNPGHYQNSRTRHSVTWNSTDVWSNGDGNETALPADKQKYALTANSAAQLKEAFETIAGESGGGSQELGEESVSEVDVVSSSFALPEGTDVSGIKVYIEKCTGRQAPKQYIDIYDNDQVKTGTFLQFEDRRGPINTVNHTNLTGFTYDDDGDPTTAEVPVDDKITVTLGKSGNDPNDPDKLDVINVNGFNYGGNWCGPVFAEGYDGDYDHVVRWNGYKVVVTIPIEMDKNAVGGPDSPTNAEGSGIKVKGNLVAEFKSPKVSLPINIHIRKEGLDEGESAKFLIERKLVSEDDSKWVEVSSVFVTRHKNQAKEGTNAPISKVVGMPSVDEQDRPFVYRVRESNWNWSYNLTDIKGPDGGGIGNLNTRSATSDELVSNPFIFVNKKKDNIDFSVRHAESKASNTFKTGVTTVEYDDSKYNNR